MIDCLFSGNKFLSSLGIGLIPNGGIVIKLTDSIRVDHRYGYENQHIVYRRAYQVLFASLCRKLIGEILFIIKDNAVYSEVKDEYKIISPEYVEINKESSNDRTYVLHELQNEEVYSYAQNSINVDVNYFCVTRVDKENWLAELNICLDVNNVKKHFKD